MRINSIYAIVLEGDFKGVAGEVVAIEMSMFEEAMCTLRIDFDNEIRISEKKLKPLTEDEYKRIVLERNRIDITTISTYGYLNYLAKSCYTTKNNFDPTTIKNVIFNDPATIVLWTDGSKTVVKCQKGDTYNKEMGLAMAILKKCCDNKGNYNNIFEKWIKD